MSAADIPGRPINRPCATCNGAQFISVEPGFPEYAVGCPTCNPESARYTFHDGEMMEVRLLNVDDLPEYQIEGDQ